MWVSGCADRVLAPTVHGDPRERGGQSHVRAAGATLLLPAHVRRLPVSEAHLGPATSLAPRPPASPSLGGCLPGEPLSRGGRARVPLWAQWFLPLLPRALAGREWGAPDLSALSWGPTPFLAGLLGPVLQAPRRVQGFLCPGSSTFPPSPSLWLTAPPPGCTPSPTSPVLCCLPGHGPPRPSCTAHVWLQSWAGVALGAGGPVWAAPSMVSGKADSQVPELRRAHSLQASGQSLGELGKGQTVLRVGRCPHA